MPAASKSCLVQHCPEDVRATALRVAAQKALGLDFRELDGILKDPELIGAYFDKPAEYG